VPGVGGPAGIENVFCQQTLRARHEFAVGRDLGRGHGVALTGGIGPQARKIRVRTPAEQREGIGEVRVEALVVQHHGPDGRVAEHHCTLFAEAPAPLAGRLHQAQGGGAAKKPQRALFRQARGRGKGRGTARAVCEQVEEPRADAGKENL